MAPTENLDLDKPSAVAQSQLDYVLQAILRLPVRRSVQEWLLAEAVRSAAHAATAQQNDHDKFLCEEMEQLMEEAGQALGLPGKATAAQTQSALVRADQRDLAKAVKSLALGRGAAAHPVRGLVGKVVKALENLQEEFGKQAKAVDGEEDLRVKSVEISVGRKLEERDAELSKMQKEIAELKGAIKQQVDKQQDAEDRFQPLRDTTALLAQSAPKEFAPCAADRTQTHDDRKPQKDQQAKDEQLTRAKQKCRDCGQPTSSARLGSYGTCSKCWEYYTR